MAPRPPDPRRGLRVRARAGDAGSVDAFVHGLPFNAAHLAMPGAEGLVLLDGPCTDESMGWAIRTGDPEFLAWLDAFLAALEASGRSDAIYERWFASTDLRDDVR